MKLYKAIIYDIDGTLINTFDMNMIPLQKIIYEETGEQWDMDDVIPFSPLPGLKVMEKLGFENKEKTYQRWVRYVNEYEGGAQVYDGITQTLEHFSSSGVSQAVVSAKTREQYEIDIVEKGLDTYFSVKVLADDTKEHKPSPVPIILCLKRLGLKPDDVIYIGDTLSDYQAANAAHVDFGYAMWGNLNDELIQSPTYRFENPLELKALPVVNKQIQ